MRAGFVMSRSSTVTTLCPCRQLSNYGDTDIDTALLTTLPIVAVITTVPPVVRPVASSTTPDDTVARLVLLEVQVATSVTSSVPLHVTAMAVRLSVVLLLVSGWALVGVTWIDWIQPTVTVTD